MTTIDANREAVAILPTISIIVGPKRSIFELEPEIDESNSYLKFGKKKRLKIT